MREPYNLKPLPVSGLNWDKFFSITIQANINIARYDEALKNIPNPRVFLSPLIIEEALQSSRIEGTQTTIKELLQFEAEADNEIKDPNIREVINYRRAMDFAVNYMKKRTLCINLLKGAHDILLMNVRGDLKARGQFRRGQVWIGSNEATKENAKYLPPKWDLVEPLMSNLEKYLHSSERDSLVQLAIIHAQFELIHPFFDGNGRLGRILLPLFLYHKGLLSSPMFYLSGYFEKNRDAYYNRLQKISTNGDWEGWIIFFLKAVKEQAQVNIDKVHNLNKTFEVAKIKLTEMRSPSAIIVLDTLFSYPIFTSTRFIKDSKLSYLTAIRLLANMESAGIIKKVESRTGPKPAKYIFPSLLKLIYKY